MAADSIVRPLFLPPPPLSPSPPPPPLSPSPPPPPSGDAEDGCAGGHEKGVAAETHSGALCSAGTTRTLRSTDGRLRVKGITCEGFEIEFYITTEAVGYSVP